MTRSPYFLITPTAASSAFPISGTSSPAAFAAAASSCGRRPAGTASQVRTGTSSAPQSGDSLRPAMFEATPNHWLEAATSGLVTMPSIMPPVRLVMTSSDDRGTTWNPMLCHATISSGSPHTHIFCRRRSSGRVTGYRVKKYIHPPGDQNTALKPRAWSSRSIIGQSPSITKRNSASSLMNRG